MVSQGISRSDQLFFLNTYVFQICKNIWRKSNEGLVLATDIWVSDQKLTFFAEFRIFKLLVEYKDMHATEKYFVNFLLVVKYAFSGKVQG